MKVAIIGYGIEGRSALHYYQDQGADITVCERNPAVPLPPGITARTGDGYLQGLDGFDVILRTASVKPADILAASPGAKGAITTVVNEFLRACPSRNTIGVTGTKGKGTTATLITNMLEAAGKEVFLGGNIGNSPLDFLPKMSTDSWAVLELSSFQLEDLTHSPHIGVCLMVAPEHLDWHGTPSAYYRAKSQLFAHQSSRDVAVYYADNLVSHRIASTSPGDKIAYYDEPGAYVHSGNIMIDQTVICKTSELLLPGKHNWQNVCAALTAAWQVTQSADAYRKALLEFRPLANRLELVRTVNGVTYYNDSYASDPYASQVAIAAIPGSKVFILGGWDQRQIDLASLAAAVKKAERDIRAAILIGESARRLATALKQAGFTKLHLSPAATMHDIVVEAAAHAKKGDSVLLSPGFPSFDMFPNFDVRGNEFKKEVNAL